MGRMPSTRQSTTVIVIILIYCVLTGIFIGIRFEHILVCGLFLALFFCSVSTRKLALMLVPFALFGLSYDWLRVFPNYKFLPVDTDNLYNLEKLLFGVRTDDGLLILGEYFEIHHHAIADLFAGIFYLCWVPVPIAFGLWLFFTGKRTDSIHFASAFLLVNLIGFCGYYIHPAAPPWYVMHYGFDVVLDTPGNVAGLARFDELLHTSLFEGIYGRNSNVFAAIPSLHASYLLVTLIYSIKSHSGRGMSFLFAVLMIGIWCTAVYTGHHYVIDVLLGIVTGLIGVGLFELLVSRWNPFRRFFERYAELVN